MIIQNISVTSMHHTTLTELDFFLSDTLCARGSDGSFRTYSPDAFRRLYNDAVECMKSYRAMAELYSDKAEHYQQLYEDVMRESDEP